ncbi:hypothetical protein [Nocardia sp. NPDC052566]|uniref:hypothetical protein n=1 Tax=Nocardia sp. NPDC052566 TaxID=3364330 RepID=UPI0037C5EA7B
MKLVSRLTVGALVFGAVLLPLAPAQAEVVSRPTAASATEVADGTGSSAQSIVCTILKLVMMNQGPANCQ